MAAENPKDHYVGQELDFLDPRHLEKAPGKPPNVPLVIFLLLTKILFVRKIPDLVRLLGVLGDIQQLALDLDALLYHSGAQKLFFLPGIASVLQIFMNKPGSCCQGWSFTGSSNFTCDLTDRNATILPNKGLNLSHQLAVTNSFDSQGIILLLWYHFKWVLLV